MSKIDEILDKIFVYGVDWTEYKDKSDNDHEVSTFAARIKAENKEALKAQLLQLVLEVIGEPRDDDRAYSADILKQQQRKRVCELFGVEE